MPGPIAALREHRRAVAEKKAEQQAHLERGIRWIAAEDWTDLVWKAPWETVLSMYRIGLCGHCGHIRMFHPKDDRKHLRLYGGQY